MPDKIFLFKLLLLAHLLADFVFQSKKMAEGKQESFGCLLKHALVYTGFMAAACFGLINLSKVLIPFFIIVLSHLILDLIKSQHKKRLHKGWGLVLFVIDQILHLLVLILCIHFFDLNSKTTTPYSMLLGIPYLRTCLNYILLVLVLSKPCSIFVRELFEALNIKEEAPYEPFDFMRTQDKSVADRRPNAGSAIGILERMIIAALILIGQPGAIGFVLTAKTIARFKELENKAFAEKYLIGTLTSVLLALFVTLVYKRFA